MHLGFRGRFRQKVIDPGFARVLQRGVAPVRQYLQHGIPLGLATDGATSNNTLDLLEQLRDLAESASSADTRLCRLFVLYERTGIVDESGAHVRASAAGDAHPG